MNQWLSAHPNWELKDKKLYREFHFKDFVEAFSWMTKSALWAEKLDHHPEWQNTYSSVQVYLTTHDTGGISPKDLQLAEKMDALKV